MPPCGTPQKYSYTEEEIPPATTYKKRARRQDLSNVRAVPRHPHFCNLCSKPFHQTLSNAPATSRATSIASSLLSRAQCSSVERAMERSFVPHPLRKPNWFGGTNRMMNSVSCSSTVLSKAKDRLSSTVTGR